MAYFVNSFSGLMSNIFSEMTALIVLAGTLIAFFCDLETGRVPNLLILILWGIGLAFSCVRGDPAFFLKGSLLPIAALWVFFHFRMIGAGDIKLLSALGGLTGLSGCLDIFVGTVLTGGILSVFILLADAGGKERAAYAWHFLKGRMAGLKEPYRRAGKQKENIHFTVAILMGVLLYVGGVI